MLKFSTLLLSGLLKHHELLVVLLAKNHLLLLHLLIKLKIELVLLLICICMEVVRLFLVCGAQHIHALLELQLQTSSKVFLLTLDCIRCRHARCETKRRLLRMNLCLCLMQVSMTSGRCRRAGGAVGGNTVVRSEAVLKGVVPFRIVR